MEQELPGMPEKGELAKLCDKFLDHRDAILDRKKDQDALVPLILEQMRADGKVEYTHGNIVFYCTTEAVKLKYREKREAVQKEAVAV